MKIFVLLLLINITLITGRLFGQSIKGNVKSKNKALQNITIRLVKDSVLIKAALSDSIGNYSFVGIKKGAYTLKFSSINFKSKSIVLDLKNDTIVNVFLSPKTEELKEVRVSAKKPLVERKIDRLVFNVAGNVNIIGLNALNVLSETPMVRVDNNEIVSIVGKGSVTIMINDKIQHMPAKALAAYLKAIPAESVERIEVITNPPAMYSAEGQSGIINIILKKNKKLGYRGSVNLNLHKATYSQAELAINMWYNKKKIRYFGSVFSGLGAHRHIRLKSVFYPSQTWNSFSKEKEYSQGVLPSFGFEVDLSKTITLGASYHWIDVFPYQFTTIRSQFIDKQTQKPDSISLQNNVNKGASSHHLANVHLVKKLETANPQKKIVIDGDWSWNSSDAPNRIDNKMYNSDNSPIGSSQTFSHNHLVASIYSLNAVVHLPKKKHEWSFGSHIDFIQDDHEVFLKINDQGHLEKSSYNKFIYHENTQALFVNFKSDFGKRWSFQSGLRGEYTQTKGVSHTIHDSTNTHAYLKLFPTVYLLYRLNSKNTLTINYGRRISRPELSSLNPYIRYQNQYAYSQGNPNLKPSISNNFELTETYGRNLNLSIQYSFSNNQISYIPVPQRSSRTIISQLTNDLSTRSFVFAGSYMLNKIKWLKSLNSLEVYYNKTISTSKYTNPILEGWSANFRSNNSIYFNKQKTLVGGMIFRYQFPGRETIYKYGSSFDIDLSGKYTFLNNKLQIGIRLSDIFRMINPMKYYINAVFYTIKTYSDPRLLTLTIKYNFGNSKLKKGRAHSVNPDKGR